MPITQINGKMKIDKIHDSSPLEQNKPKQNCMIDKWESQYTGKKSHSNL